MGVPLSLMKSTHLRVSMSKTQKKKAIEESAMKAEPEKLDEGSSLG